MGLSTQIFDNCEEKSVMEHSLKISKIAVLDLHAANLSHFFLCNDCKRVYFYLRDSAKFDLLFSYMF